MALVILVGVPVLVWGALLYPGWLLWGSDAILHSGVALILCLVPAVGTYVAVTRLAKSGDGRSVGALGASGVRMAVSLGIGMLLHLQFEELFPAVFLYWLSVFYLLILGLEITLLTRAAHAE